MANAAVIADGPAEEGVEDFHTVKRGLTTFDPRYYSLSTDDAGWENESFLEDAEAASPCSTTAPINGLVIKVERRYLPTKMKSRGASSRGIKSDPKASRFYVPR
jgi:hypothetical protein